MSASVALAENPFETQTQPQEGLLAQQLVGFANEAFVLGASAARPPQQRECDTDRARFSEKFFADVSPAPLSPLHLQNTRVLPHREALLQSLPKGKLCLEIGAGNGALTRQILLHLAPGKLHVCDRDFHSFDDSSFDSAGKQGVIEYHEGDAAEYLAALPDSYADLIFLRPGPSYSATARALEQAGRKLKDDGAIICGNYTTYSPLDGAKYGVARAVNEFCHAGCCEISHLAFHPLGFHDVALRKCAAPLAGAHLNGLCLEAPDTNTFLPDVWEYLIGKYDIRSVLDIGAGAGWTTKWFVDRGIYTLGVESSREALEKCRCRANIVEHDYRTGPFIPSMVLDLAWCAGFVEQIEEEYMLNFISSFRACRYVCLTHAEPGRQSPHNVNCQATEYWIDKMDNYGFDFDEAETAYLRSTDKYKTTSGRRTLAFFKTRT